jgi:hypothetical protein
MPRAEPVMIAFFPSRSPIVFSSFDLLRVWGRGSYSIV